MDVLTGRVQIYYLSYKKYSIIKKEKEYLKVAV
jgi:hypothetical protein